jgi:hypothetical protein
MKKFLLLATALSACSPAMAADLMLRKAPAAVAFPYSGSGWYFGVGTKGGVDQVSNSGTALFATSLVGSGLNALGAGVGGDIGYFKTFGPGGVVQWAAFEASAYYQNITASTTATNGAAAVPVSYASRWSADQVVKLGGFNLLTYLPNLGISFPALPPLPTVGGLNTLQPGLTYVSFGLEEFGVDGQFFTASGSTIGVAPLVGAGVFSEILDTTGKPTGNVLDVGAQVVFADKGLGISNAFSSSGAPVFGTLSVGRKYEVYAKIDF